MSSTPRPPRRARLAWLALAALVVAGLAVLALGPPLHGLVAGRLRAAAAARGLDASWTTLRIVPPFGVRLAGLALTRRGDGEAVFRTDSLAANLDPWSLVQFQPRVASVDLAGATMRRPRGAGVDPDTLAPDDPEPPRGRAGDEARAERLREAARSLIRVLVAPARSLPRLSLRDVTLASGDDAGDSAGTASGIHLATFLVTPHRGGVRIAARGTLHADPPVPFDGALDYGHDDRLRGTARFDIADRDSSRPEAVTLTIDGALHQDRRAGRVTIVAPTRLSLGSLRFDLGGVLDRGGPSFRLTLDADSLTATQWQASLPRAVLGPLARLAVHGWYGYHVRLDLDLSRPDSVDFAADVVPHGLTLDPARTNLPILGLDEPFVARIHLPRDRIVERDLSLANPHFLPLTAIDTLLTHAVLTNEDGSFFRHQGFNLEAVRGAIADNLKAGAYRRGAGTITMQLVRNLYLGHARTLSRKGQEVVLAWVLEHLTPVSKGRMLEIYLNVIEWGPGVHGADEAARYYFGHGANQTTIAEALFLATVIPAPTKWRYRFDAAGSLRPFARAQMHFIGRAMIARGWLAPEALPPAEALDVELGDPARRVLFPEAPPDSSEA